MVAVVPDSKPVIADETGERVSDLDAAALGIDAGWRSAARLASVSARAGTSEHSATACMTRVSVAAGAVLVSDLLDLVTPGGRERFLEQPRWLGRA